MREAWRHGKIEKGIVFIFVMLKTLDFYISDEQTLNFDIVHGDKDYVV